MRGTPGRMWDGNVRDRSSLCPCAPDIPGPSRHWFSPHTSRDSNDLQNSQPVRRQCPAGEPVQTDLLSVRDEDATVARFAVVAERRDTAASPSPSRCCLTPPRASTPSSPHARCRRLPTTSHTVSSPRLPHHACTLHASAGGIPPRLVLLETDTTRP